MARKKRHQIDIILSIIILMAIVSVGYYLYTIITSPPTKQTGYTATVTLVWRNVPKELANNIKIHDPIIIGNKPTYVVVGKWIKPHMKAVPTPHSATVVPSVDTFNIYVAIRNIRPLTSTIPPVGKDLALLGNLLRIKSYIWQFDGIVVDVKTGTFSEAPAYTDIPNTTGCSYKIIARNVYPSVISHITIGEPLYDILGNKVLRLDNFRITHPYIYGWTPSGIKHMEDPTQTDLIITASPLSSPIPVEINGKQALVGSTLEIRGKDWRVWGRILEVVCP